MQENKTLSSPIQVFYMYRKNILICTVLGLILGYILTLPIITRPMYKAESRFFVPFSNMSELLLETGFRFGSDQQIDEYLALFESKALYTAFVQLWFPQKNAEEQESLSNYIQSNTQAKRTKFGSIDLHVFYHHADSAKWICNELINSAEELKAKMYAHNNSSLTSVAESHLITKRTELLALQDSLKNYVFGIHKDELLMLEKGIEALDLKLREKHKQIQSIRKELNSYKPDHDLFKLQEDWIHYQAEFEHTKGQLSVFENYLPEKDTLRIKENARKKGIEERLNNIQSQKSKLNTQEMQFVLLMNEVLTLNENKRILSNDYTRLQFSQPNYNSNPEVIRLEQRFRNELNEYNLRKAYYEKTLRHAEAPVSKVYIAQDAVTNQKPAKPNKLLYVFGLGLLSSLLYLCFIVVKERLLF